jgi:hypothetical protein
LNFAYDVRRVKVPLVETHGEVCLLTEAVKLVMSGARLCKVVAPEPGGVGEIKKTPLQEAAQPPGGEKGKTTQEEKISS